MPSQQHYGKYPLKETCIHIPACIQVPFEEDFYLVSTSKSSGFQSCLLMLRAVFLILGEPLWGWKSGLIPHPGGPGSIPSESEIFFSSSHLFLPVHACSMCDHGMCADPDNWGISSPHEKSTRKLFSKVIAGWQAGVALFCGRSLYWIFAFSL